MLLIFSVRVSPSECNFTEIKVMNAKDRYDSLFQYYGEVYGVDWVKLKAQARAESDMDSTAESKAGAKGLTQFMDRTWREWRDGTPGIQEIDIDIAKLSPYDPEDAIKAQAAYMAWLHRKTGGELHNALVAYNWGIGNYYKWKNGLIPDLPRETKEYVCRIYGYLNIVPPTVYEKTTI
jgi:soluble lytic murein transglycosylase-like protein